MERKNPCDEFNDLAYRLGEMSLTEKLAYENHLKECDKCRDEQKVLDSVFDISISDKLATGEFCLSTEDLLRVSKVGAQEGTAIARHLSICPLCQAEIEAFKAAEAFPVEPLPRLSGKVLTGIQLLQSSRGSRIIEFPITRIRPLAGVDEHLRFAAAGPEEALQADRHEEHGILVVASVT